MPLNILGNIIIKIIEFWYLSTLHTGFFTILWKILFSLVCPFNTALDSCVCVCLCVCLCVSGLSEVGSHPSARGQYPIRCWEFWRQQGVFFSLFISVPFVCDSLKCCSTHPSIIHFTPFFFFFLSLCYFLFSLSLCCVIVCLYVSAGFVTACAHISMCVCVCVFVSICVRFWMSVYIWMCVCVYVSSPLSWLQFLCRQMQLLDRAA